MTTRRIDSHQHFWLLERDDYDWLTPDLAVIYRDFMPDDLRPLLAATGMQETVVVQAAATVDETRFLLELAERTDFIAGVVGWVDLERPEAPELIAELAENSYLRGVRPMIQDIPDDDWMLRVELEHPLRALADADLTFDALVFPRHLPNLMKFLARHPELSVVVDHGAKPQIARGEFADWARDIGRIAHETGAYCKLSGLVTEAGQEWTFESLAPYIDHLFECFGPERLMWGSDWPPVELGGGHAAWWEVTLRVVDNLDASARDAVLGGTAARFYGV